MPAGKPSPKRPGRRGSSDDATKSDSGTVVIPLPPDAALLVEEMTAWAARIRRWANGIATDAANSASQRAYAETARKRADNALDYLAAIPTKYAKRMDQSAKASPDPIVISHHARAGELGSAWVPTGTSTEGSLRQALANLASQALAQELRATWAFLVHVDKELLRVNNDAPATGRKRGIKRASPIRALRAYVSDIVKRLSPRARLPDVCKYLAAEANFSHQSRHSAAGVTCIAVELDKHKALVAFRFSVAAPMAGGQPTQMRKTRAQLAELLKQANARKS
jgi:hypothetical protein